jgi:hypothetical protein
MGAVLGTVRSASLPTIELYGGKRVKKSRTDLPQRGLIPDSSLDGQEHLKNAVGGVVIGPIQKLAC